jgi:hypothetical protein
MRACPDPSDVRIPHVATQSLDSQSYEMCDKTLLHSATKYTIDMQRDIKLQASRVRRGA